jgi:hypothetical protein
MPAQSRASITSLPLTWLLERNVVPGFARPNDPTSGNLDLIYNTLGNITDKTGIGAYGYHPTKVHAV